MLRAALISILPLFVLLPPIGPALAEDGPAGDGIAWSESLTSGLAEAKESGKILMICINAKSVQGEKEERAAKGLREVVYRDPRIVTRSRDFVCVFLTPESGSTAHAELSMLGVGGEIVSPQHIFVAPEGDRILYRKEYWPYGTGEKAVEALLDMMAKAEGKSGEPVAPSGGGGGGDAAPAEGEARTEWIAEQLKLVMGNFEERKKALDALIRADKDGDCTGPLIELLPENKKNTDLLWDLIRALGRDGLEAAALPIAEFLVHRDESIRANAAVSLEYIGSRDKKVVSKLMSAAGKQKDEAISNHVYRALGRCGSKDAKVRELLLKMTAAGKSEFATFGPAIGLAYFEGDEKAARGVEKLLGQLGMPGGGRRGGGQNGVKRGVLSWTLACIQSEKSAKFVREELLAKLENMKAFWVEGMRRFWEGVAKACEGDEEALPGVVAGVRVIAGFARGFGGGGNGGEPLTLMDAARKGRENAKFTPKGDWLLEAGGGD